MQTFLQCLNPTTGLNIFWTAMVLPIELFSRRRWTTISAQQSNEWNVTRHVLHYFLGYSETQQLTTWADPAFISFYMSYLSSREKENGIESAHEARPNKNETMAKVSISPEKRPNLFRENRSRAHLGRFWSEIVASKLSFINKQN